MLWGDGLRDSLEYSDGDLLLYDLPRPSGKVDLGPTGQDRLFGIRVSLSCRSGAILPCVSASAAAEITYMLTSKLAPRASLTHRGRAAMLMAGLEKNLSANINQGPNA